MGDIASHRGQGIQLLGDPGHSRRLFGLLRTHRRPQNVQGISLPLNLCAQRPPV